MTQISQPETHDQRTARHLETLREVTELARALARKAGAEALAMPPDPPAAPDGKQGRRAANDPRAVFERLLRAITRMIALECRILGQKPAARPAASIPAPLAEPAAAPGLASHLSRHDRRALEKRLRSGQV